MYKYICVYFQKNVYYKINVINSTDTCLYDRAFI